MKEKRMDILRVDAGFASSPEILAKVIKTVAAMQTEYLGTGDPFRKYSPDEVLVHCRDLQSECRKIYAAVGLLAHLHVVHDVPKILECAGLLGSYVEKATDQMSMPFRAILEQIPNDMFNPDDMAKKWLKSGGGEDSSASESDEVPF